MDFFYWFPEIGASIIIGIFYAVRIIDVINDIDIINELNKKYPHLARYYGIEEINWFTYFIIGFLNVSIFTWYYDIYFTDKLILNKKLKEAIRFKRWYDFIFLIVLITLIAL